MNNNHNDEKQSNNNTHENGATVRNNRAPQTVKNLHTKQHTLKQTEQTNTHTHRHIIHV